MKKKLFLFLAGITLVMGGVMYLYSLESNKPFIVPVLAPDGTVVTAVVPRVGGLLGSVIVNSNVPGVQVKIWDIDEDVIIDDTTDQYLHAFRCSSTGVSLPAPTVLGSYPWFYGHPNGFTSTGYASAPRVWAWGPYPSTITSSYIFATGSFFGNVAAQSGGLYEFIGSSTGFTTPVASGYIAMYVASVEINDGDPDVRFHCRSSTDDGEANWFPTDADGDGLNYLTETGSIANGGSATDVGDNDTDDDGLLDGEELTASGAGVNAISGGIDINDDTYKQIYRTDPRSASGADTDSDGLYDGTELGRDTGENVSGTNLGASLFVVDADSGATTTDPSTADTDTGTVGDGTEDGNQDGDVDNHSGGGFCEGDPNNASDDVVACGDGTLQKCGADFKEGTTGDNELCDDGNTSDNDTCPSGVTGQCLAAAATCGDGIVCSDGGCTTGPGSGPEECDDGNEVDNDSCTNSCASSSCGDGIIGPGEECDDSDTSPGDGCDASCLVEDGWECTGEPSTCEFIVPDP